MRIPQVGDPWCSAFDKYKVIPETVSLDFSEDDVTRVASKLSDVAGALGAEALKIKN